VINSIIRMVATEPDGAGNRDGCAYLAGGARDVFFANNNIVTAGNRNSWGFRLSGGDNALFVDNTVRVSFHKMIRMNDGPVDYVYVKGGTWMREATLTAGGLAINDSWAQLGDLGTDQVYLHDPTVWLASSEPVVFGASFRPRPGRQALGGPPHRLARPERRRRQRRAPPGPRRHLRRQRHLRLRRRHPPLHLRSRPHPAHHRLARSPHDRARRSRPAADRAVIPPAAARPARAPERRHGDGGASAVRIAATTGAYISRTIAVSGAPASTGVPARTGGAGAYSALSASARA
jgi:hypothetical protein